ncbi:hypothetical protein J7K93_00815 [bacterium]|nr:hypothetical protein [bacterium]
MRKNPLQTYLFEKSEIQNDRERIAELDNLIKKALRKNDYDSAKLFTEEQRSLLNKLVNGKGG